MAKIIWTCWFQGRHAAPEVVRKCIDSWEAENPGWELRCLDAHTVTHYVDLSAHVDLERQTITAASLSDILRLLLLNEYGGVWVDATTYCNAPLDDWLPFAAQTGFFAFARPAEDREIATWFVAARPGNELLAKWAARAMAYWQGRESTRDYFWVHHQFGELCAVDRDAFRAWHNMPRISADRPHAIQSVGMYEDFETAKAQIDWTTPVFKLSYRLDHDQLRPTSLVTRLLGLSNGVPSEAPQEQAPQTTSPVPAIGLLKVSTENLGDHIQILAGEKFLRRAGIEPTFTVDRDDEIAHPPPASEAGILLNGWFKTNPSEWPPHPAYRPIYLGFHIRLFQASSLVSPAALDHYTTYGPIGCRDRYTLSLLRSHGVEAFLSHCLSLTFPRRLPNPEEQTETFVVSRDRKILDYIPASLGAYTFLSHYSGDKDFVRNKEHAGEMLKIYKTRAKLVVTTMLHCALPVIAMGIPVVVFLPCNEGAEHESDKERFSSLSEIVRVFHPSEASTVDWRGYTPDVGALKLKLLDSFLAMATRWGRLPPTPLSGIAPPSALPVPAPPVQRPRLRDRLLARKPRATEEPYDYFNDPERLERLAREKAPDRQRWGASSSHKPEWGQRGLLAAKHVRDGSRVLEIGAGVGTFRELVANRCHYTGTDLHPLDEGTVTLDIENDPIPPGPWDAIVLLGVLEYLHDPLLALARVGAAGQSVVLSYCVPRGPDSRQPRAGRGWINDLSERDLVAAMAACGLALTSKEDVNAAEDFEQRLYVFARQER